MPNFGWPQETIPNEYGELASSPLFECDFARWVGAFRFGCRFWLVGLTNEAAEQLVQNTADQVIHEIATRQTELDKDPSVLLDIVDKTLLPEVDSERMSRLVLGRYWRTASASQKAAFTEQFKRLLVRTYAGPLSKLGNQTIKVTGTKPGSDNDEVEVLSVVSGGDMGSVPVDYRMATVDGKWKAYDVVIDGISLVNNYRGSFAQVIQKKVWIV